MISQSVPLMTAIDLAILALISFSINTYIRDRGRIAAAGETRRFLLTMLGLSIVAGFYFSDLVIMHLLPRIGSDAEASSAMSALHLEYSWIVIPAGLGLVTYGFTNTGRRLLSLIDQAKIAESKSLDEARHRKEAENISSRLGRIVEDSANEIYVFGAGTLKFEMVNKGARDNLGFTMEELAQMTPVDIKPEFTEQEFLELVAPLKSGEQNLLQFNTVHQRKDKSLYDVSVSLHLAGEKGAEVFFAVIEDATESNLSLKQLQQAQKMEAVGQLSGGIAHDFNNLLLVIMGNLERMREEGTTGEDFLQTIEILERAAGRGAALTTRLLAFARRQPLEPKEVDVNDLTKSMTEMLSRILGEHIEIETVLAGGLWGAEVDPAQLENAIMNLAINAREAMPEGGKLTIETSNSHLDDAYAIASAEVTAGQYVLLAISDTGEGMSQEVMDRAFEPFFTTRPVGKGSGLGLSMVYGFVKQSGGHVKLYSEDQGTTVKLYFPRAGAGSHFVAEKRADDNKMPGGKETVMVVEDDEEVREYVVGTLSDLGYNVVAAAYGLDALDKMEGIEKLDLLLTDVVLPGGMNGRQIAEEMVRQRPDLKVLYTSGYSANAIIHHGKLDADVEFLAKPYKRRDLMRKVRAILDRD